MKCKGLSKTWMVIFRSSHWTCSVRKGLFRNFAKFTGKHLYQGLFLIKLQSDTVFKQLKNGYRKRNIFFAEKECRIIKLQVKIVAFREHGDFLNLTIMTLHHNIDNFFNFIYSKLFHFLVSSLSLSLSLSSVSLSFLECMRFSIIAN